MTLKIESLYHAYGRKTAPAVNNLELSVPQGALYVLLGPSGCGKTTTMRCIAGLERPLRGRITVNDRVMFDINNSVFVPPHKRNIGMVFQSYAIWPNRTVFENVAFPLRMQRVSRKEAASRVSEVLEKVGLGGYERRGASMLSGGQMQRVALARSIVMRPGVLLFDEPLSNLDARLRETLRFELRALQQEFAFTAIYVTHDQTEAMALADEIAVMKDGEIVQRGTPTELYSNPASSFIAAFLGVGNLLSGRVLEVTGQNTRVRLDRSGAELSSQSRAKTGDRVTACIRDEDVLVEERGRSVAATDGELQGVVKVASFQGSEIRYQCVVGDGLEVRSTMPASAQRFEPGTEVSLRIRRGGANLIPAETSSA